MYFILNWTKRNFWNGCYEIDVMVDNGSLSMQGGLPTKKLQLSTKRGFKVL